jgi:prevent-host-death family protein
MTQAVNIHSAKTHLSRLLERVRLGEEVILAKAGKPIARLVPLAETAMQRLPGSAQGVIAIGEDFDEPLPVRVARKAGR